MNFNALKFYLSIYIALLCGFSVYGQKINITTSFDRQSKGLIQVQIRDNNGNIMDNSQFCYSWSGPNGFKSSAAQPSSLGLGLYCVKIVDCKQLLGQCTDNPDKPKSLFYFGCVTVTGSTCEATLFSPSDLSATPASGRLCENATTGTISFYTNQLQTSCSAKQFCWIKDWYKNGEKIGTGNSISNVGAGLYCIHIHDSYPNNVCNCFCEAYYCIEIKSLDSDPLYVEGVVKNITCDASGSIDVTVTGGKAPYTIQWDGGGSTLNNVSSPGTYCVSVRDKCNNIERQCYTISKDCIDTGSPTDCSNPLSIQAHVTPKYACVKKAKGSDYFQSFWYNGFISVDVSGGSGNYSYKWDNSPSRSSYTVVGYFGPNRYCVDILDNDCGTTRRRCYDVQRVLYPDWCPFKYRPQRFRAGNNRLLPEIEKELFDTMTAALLSEKEHTIVENISWKGIPKLVNDKKSYEIWYKDLNIPLYTMQTETAGIQSRNLVELSNTDSDTQGFNLSPVPAIDNVLLQIESRKVNTTTVTIYSITGQQLLTQKIDLDRGYNAIPITTAELKSGTYLVSIPGYSTNKMIILK